MRLACCCFLLIQLAACDVLWRPWTIDNPTACRSGEPPCPDGTGCDLDSNMCLPVTAKLASVTPSLGPTSGGITISVGGLEFHDGATVTVDGEPAFGVMVLSPNEIVATLPSRLGVLGHVAVAVKNPGEPAVSRSDLFAYFASDIQFTTTPVAPLSGGTAVITGDWNRDQNVDLAVASDVSNEVSVLLGNGLGGFATPTGFSISGTICSVVAGDFNGDMKPDLAVPVQSTGKVGILLGDGVGSFAAPNYFSAGMLPRFAAVADFNGDLKLDVVVADPGSASVTVLPGDGLGGLGNLFPFSARSDQSTVVVADWNGDGRPDVATTNTSTRDVSILLGDGLGGLGAATAVFTDDRAPNFAAVGDFNGDQKLDLVVTQPGSSISVLLGNGLGGFGSPMTFQVGEGPEGVAVGDLNGDFILDLAVAVGTDSSVSVLIGDGLGGFAAPVKVSVSMPPHAVAIADFDKDQHLDIVVSGGAAVVVLLNRSR